MKHLFFFLLAVAAIPAVAQKQFTKTGHIWFYSAAPLENIEAHNYQATSILNPETGDLVFKVVMNGFQFPNAEMQRHFNEKYVESEKYPQSVFTGKIMNREKVNFAKDGSYEVVVEGNLEMHGVTQPVKSPGTITIKGGKVSATSLFQVAVADYQIKIPAAVKDNIAKTIDIHVDVQYEPMPQ